MLINCLWPVGRLALAVYYTVSPKFSWRPPGKEEKTIVKPWSVVQGWVGRAPPAPKCVLRLGAGSSL